MTARRRPSVPALLGAAILLLGTARPAATQDAPAPAPPLPPPAPVAPAPVAPPRAAAAGLVRRTVSIPLSDGGALAADVHAPADDVRRPAIVVQTPYGRERFAPTVVLDDPDGYAFVVVDVRGRGGSRGVPTKPGFDVRRRDGFDTVEWVAAQPFCDGRVGTWGPSALGQQQFRTAEAAPPHLRCAVPVVSAFGWRHGSFHPGGVLRDEYARTIDRLGFGAGGLIREHPLDDVAWRLLARAPAPERIAVPVLMIGGWYDLHAAEMPADFAELVARSAPAVRDAHRLLMGPWTHHLTTSFAAGEAGAWDAATFGVAKAAVAAWFDQHLRGRDVPPTPRVRYAVLGAGLGETGRWETGRWESADAWPPPTTTATRFFARDGALAATAPADATTVAFRHDPARPVPTVGGANLDPSLRSGPRDQRAGVLDHPGVVAFTTEPLVAPLALRGAVRARLHVTLAGDAPSLDADLHVRLADVGPDGAAVLLADGARRVSSREGFARRAPVAAGVPYEVEVVLPDLAADVVAGHRLLVAVAGSNAPRYEVAPVPVTVTLTLSATGSRLELPIATTTPR